MQLSLEMSAEVRAVQAESHRLRKLLSVASRALVNETAEKAPEAAIFVLNQCTSVLKAVEEEVSLYVPAR